MDPLTYFVAMTVAWMMGIACPVLTVVYPMATAFVADINGRVIPWRHFAITVPLGIVCGVACRTVTLFVLT